VQEWSLHGNARQMYESRWLHLVSRTKGNKELGRLTYADVPWPAEEGASAEEILSVLLAGIKVCHMFCKPLLSRRACSSLWAHIPVHHLPTCG
jgi:hypothetical protein